MTTIHNLSAMSLQQLATLVGIPSIIKMSKAKAIERATKALDAMQNKDADSVSNALDLSKFVKSPVKPAVVPAQAAKVEKAKPAKKIAAAPKSKEVKAPRVSKFDLLRNALAKKHTYQELVDLVGTTEKNLRTMMSDVQNPKYSRGEAIKIVRTGDFYQAA